jgi:PEP-CTERM motif
MRIAKDNQMKPQRMTLVLAVLALIGFAAETAKGDPLVFSNVTAFQNNNTLQVSLVSNPSVTLQGTNLTFSVDVAGTLSPGVVDTLRITYTEAGSTPIVQSFDIPLFGTVQPPFTLIFSVVSPGATPQGVAATLTLDLLLSSPDFIIPFGPNQGQAVDSFTYTFTVQQPVPEPATLFAFTSGLAALGVFRRRRSR